MSTDLAGLLDEREMMLNNSDKTVLAKILQLIRVRQYEPGERILSERELAEKFETSRPTIREALATLEAMRVIERRPNAGIYLRDLHTESLEALVLQTEAGLPLKRDEITQAMEVRRIMEIQAVRLACERRTDADLDRMQACLDRSEALIAFGESISDEDRRFHLAICQATKNDILLKIVNTFYELSASRRSVFFADAERCRISHGCHKAIFDAIKGKNRALAEKLMGEHLAVTVSAWEILLGTSK